MRRPTRFLLAVACLLVARAAVCSAATLRGRVTEPAGAVAIEGAEVVVRSAADSVVVAHVASGADGRFSLAGIPAGRYVVRIASLGHVSQSRGDVTLAADSDLDLGTVALAVSPLAVPGAEVATSRATAVLAPDRNIYLARDIPAAGAGTTTDLLRAVPELDVDLNGRVSLRGSTGVTVQVNGRTSPLKGEALQTFLRQLPGSRVERVEVITNPSARFDPEGGAGVVNIVLKDDVKLGVSGSVNAYAGPRWAGFGNRVAWQQGPLTLFGGTSLSVYRWEYASTSLRRSFLSTPPSELTSDVESRSNGLWSGSDLSADLAVTKRVTVYGTLNANPNGGEPHGTTEARFTDSTGAVTSWTERIDDSDNSARSYALTFGAQHVKTKGRDERSIEFLQSVNTSSNETDGRQRTLVPDLVPDLVSWRSTSSSYRERSLELDDTHPIGAKGKLESGWRVAERVNTSAGGVEFAGEDVADQLTGYRHRELFHSLYLTAGSTFGRFSSQLGARGELARTSFDVPPSALHFDRDYRSLFPSASLAWDFGRGRTMRLSYSKRIERPSAQYLSPVVPASDSLDRFTGNPDLGPKYTHAVSFDAAWSGSRGLLKLSPYWRNTVDNWDVVTSVNASGAAVSTYRNASSVRVAGVSVTASLRQTGRFGGTLTWGVAREHHDASNVSEGFRTDVTAWSANGNATFKATKKLDLQGYLRYAPPRTLAQGLASAFVGTSLGARWEFRKSAWLSMNVNDPFQLAKYWSETGDETYSQRTDTRNRQRSVGLNATWTWGRMPEQKQRRQSAEPQQSEQGAPAGR